MLPLIFAAATTAVSLDARHASLLAMMQREGVCGDAAAQTCTQAAATAEIRELAIVDGADVALVSFQYDNTICGNVNCPYLVVSFRNGSAQKMLWTDGYAIAVGTESPLPTLRVTSHDSADTNYLSRFEWHNGQYVRAEYLREQIATGETRPAVIPVAFRAGASSAVVRGNVSHYWSATYELTARSGQQLTISAVKSPQPLLMMLDGPDGLPVAANVAAGTPYPLSSNGTYQLSVYLDTTEGPDRDQPFQLTVTIR